MCIYVYWVKSVKSLKSAEIGRILHYYEVYTTIDVFLLFLKIFGPLFDIHTFVGVAEMLKIAENSLRNRRFFDDFSAVFGIFAIPDIE